MSYCWSVFRLVLTFEHLCIKWRLVHKVLMFLLPYQCFLSFSGARVFCSTSLFELFIGILVQRRCWYNIAPVVTDARKIDALNQWCLRMLLGIKWYQFVRNDDVRRLTKQPKLTAIIRSRRLTLFGRIMRMDDNADAKRILLASPPADWRRQLGRPRITWLSTIQQDLKHHHLTLPEAADLAVYRYISTTQMLI